LKAELDEIEKQHIKSTNADLTETRIKLAAALRDYTKSRLELGEILSEYKKHFKRTRGWLPAAEAIGAAIRRDKRTVFRIIKDYEFANKLPALVLEALVARGINPAEAKNSRTVQKLLQMPTPASPEEAQTAVTAALNAVGRIATRKTAKAEPDSLEDFTKRIVQLFVNRYGVPMLKERADEVSHTLKMVVSALGAQIYDLSKPSRQESDSMPKPDPPKSDPAIITSKKGVSSLGDLPLFASLSADIKDTAA
jgi:hypothetical protein